MVGTGGMQRRARSLGWGSAGTPRVALWLVGAVLLARLLGSLLYGVGASDPVSLIGVSVMLLAVGALAAFLPALRASRSDPAMVMREN